MGNLPNKEEEEKRRETREVKEGTEENNVIEILQERGAKRKQEEEQKKGEADILVSAIRQGEVEKVTQLLRKQKRNVNKQNSDGITALHVAAQLNEQKGKEIWKVLVECKAHVNGQNIFGKTPLWEAVYAENTSFAKFLLENGADVNGYQFLLYEAIKLAKGVEIVKLLLDYGADMSAPGNENILCAAVYCDSRIVKLLLKHGARIDERNEENKTPMQIAADKLFFYSARELILYGADIYYRDKNSVSLLYNAVKHGMVDLVWALMTSGANVEWDQLHPTVWEMSANNKPMRKALLHLWTPGDHFRHNKKIRDAIMSFLIIAKREKWMFDKPTLHLIFSYIAYNFIPTLRRDIPDKEFSRPTTRL